MCYIFIYYKLICRIVSDRNVFLQVIEKVFRLIDESGDGLVTQSQIMDFLTNLTNARYVCVFYTFNIKFENRV